MLGGGGGAGSRAGASFEFDVKELGDVIPLPKQVREKWEATHSSGTDGGRRRKQPEGRSLEAITARLERAERKRMEFQRWLMKKARPSTTGGPAKKNADEEARATAARKLEERLAMAARKRRSTLEAVRLKAATMLQRSEEVAERVTERQEVMLQKVLEALRAADSRRLALLEAERERLSAAHELVVARLAQAQQKEQQERDAYREQLGAKMVQADALRKARLDAAAAKAGSTVRHAKRVCKRVRHDDERRANMKRLTLTSRLRDAADRRLESQIVRNNAIAEKEETFLKRQSVKRETLRRQISSRKLQQFWVKFRCHQETTHQLAAKFAATCITFLTPESNKADVQSTAGDAVQGTAPVLVGGPVSGGVTLDDGFEKFAERLQSEETLLAAKRLLHRLQKRLQVKGEWTHECAPLLKRLYPKVHKSKLERYRYPSRIFLCSYMILNHPDAVFNSKGEREDALTSAARNMVDAFERLLQRIIFFDPKLIPSTGNGEGPPEGEFDTLPEETWDLKLDDGEFHTIAELVTEFDRLWVAYLEQFIAWKSHDVDSLSAELIKTAVAMEASMLRKIGGDIDSLRVIQNSDLQAVVEQVRRDHNLLRERINSLSGVVGVEKLETALRDIRSSIQQENQQEKEVKASDSDVNPTKKRRSQYQGNTSSASNGTAWSSSDDGDLPQHIPADGSPPRRQSNEDLVWELLYDPGWQYPTQDVEAAWTQATQQLDEGLPDEDTGKLPPREAARTLEQGLHRIVEKAYWDSIELKLTSLEKDAAEQLAAVLEDLGSELSKILPERSAASVLDMYKKDQLLAVLSIHDDKTDNPLGPIDTEGLLQLLKHSAELLRDFGAPAREDGAIKAQNMVHELVTAALSETDSVKQRQALGRAVSRALKLLFAQLKVLKMDAANARLKMLSATLTGTAAVDYVRGKFATAFNVPADFRMENAQLLLPKTTKWIQQAQNIVSSIQELLGETTGQKVPQIPQELRSGFDLTQRTRSSSSEPTVRRWPEMRMVSPVDPVSWQGTVRYGIVGLISSGTPVSAQIVPETFLLDTARLRAAQDRFQELLVMAAATFVMQQFCQNKGRVMSQAQMDTAKVRLHNILANPQTNLTALTEEMYIILGSSSAEAQSQVSGMMMTLLEQKGTAFGVLLRGLTNALKVLLIVGPSTTSSDLQRKVHSILTRVGAASVVDETIALAGELANIAGVNEAVHGHLYQQFRAE